MNGTTLFERPSPQVGDLEWQSLSAMYHRYNTTRPKVTQFDFRVYHPAGDELLGTSPRIYQALKAEEPVFHEAGVFIAGLLQDELFVTSNHLCSNGNKRVVIHKITRDPQKPTRWSREMIDPGQIVMANGAAHYPPLDGIIFCAQGDHEDAGGLMLMDRRAPSSTMPLLRTYHGRRFNSPNDVVTADDGSIWFTDPPYGFEQGFRCKCELPAQVYRYDPQSDDLRAMADQLNHPNGLCFSPDGQTLYVTDTDCIRCDGTTDDQKVASIYAYTVKSFYGSSFLTDWRLFAMADCGAPDGIKCDEEGFVYSGCGDGLNVWTPGGSLCLKVLIPGGVANFCFGRPGEVLILNEKLFLVALIAPHVRGANQGGRFV